MAFKPLPQADLDHILRHTEPLWQKLRGSQWFITGGTGFFGKWLLESIAAANDALGSGVTATILSRSPGKFASDMPHIANRQEFSWQAGDITDFEFPSGKFDHIFHLATAASAHLNETRPQEMLATIIDGTRRVLEFARHCGASRLLLASSGAVYGRQPPELSHIPETFPGGPDTLSPASAYAEGKRVAELLCALTPEVECIIARCFAFVGPHLPLNAHFAAGNFLRDTLAGGPIIIKGNGSPLRSYMHAADLVIWLVALLVRGQSLHPYNVGSPEPVSIGDLANRLARVGGLDSRSVQILSPADGRPPERYVPDVARARELGLPSPLPLDEALTRSFAWLSS